MPDDKNVIGGPISDEIFDSLPFISVEDGMKSRTGLPAPAYEKFVDALRPVGNVVNLGLRRLLRSRSPWE